MKPGLLKIGIARGITQTALVPAFEAALAGGFDHLEITMNTAGAPELIRLAAAAFAGRAVIGAGTVTTTEELRIALDAGARFIISPLTDEGMIAFCRGNGIPVYPGALTPTEIHRAWQAGATMVKVFPLGSVGGPAYLKEIRGPFPQIPLLACGGVTAANLADHLAAGAVGIGIGGQIFNKTWIAQQNWARISEAARGFTA
jgi:2-dehydro-3-deoxyphosphogluconate aldolase/(4S)-4-hydroxy-2-oxoglutarate aldolase